MGVGGGGGRIAYPLRFRREGVLPLFPGPGSGGSLPGGPLARVRVQFDSTGNEEGPPLVEQALSSSLLA